MARNVYRTAVIALRPTTGQRRRCYAQLRAAGDVWAWVLDCNREIRSWGDRPIVAYQALCRELSNRGAPFGELSAVGVRSVLRRYSIAWFQAAKRRRDGRQAGFPRRKRALFPVQFYSGTFMIQGKHLRLPVARGFPDLWIRLARGIPYPVGTVRSVTLLHQGGRLCLAVSAALPVEDRHPCASKVAGVDLGIIHPYAVAIDDEGLLVSGRALRAEARLHLTDTKGRGRRAAAKAPKPRVRGSRRWRAYCRAQRQVEGRHRRRIHQGHHEAARQVIYFAVERHVGTLVIGRPSGLLDQDFGSRHNRRLVEWRYAHLLRTLRDKAERMGIRISVVDERGTSSTCPECSRRVTKPSGRVFNCPHCGYQGHRDLVGARNIAARGGGYTRATSRVLHRRAGHPPARRDRRRHLLDLERRRQSCLAPGHPLTRDVARRRPCLTSGSRAGGQGGHDGEDRVPSSAWRFDDALKVHYNPSASLAGVR